VAANAVIREIFAPRSEAARGAEIVHCASRVLMPGLIDAHHVYALSLNMLRVAQAESDAEEGMNHDHAGLSPNQGFAEHSN
jgi:imidazolonepropionase-like amidohydrolase